ncbi:MAG: hypothetical protein FJ108_10190 [Deltaproteobacteria bacterium]|nr:hypothetical protein [Deltaproteobacteria bacterium]
MNKRISRNMSDPESRNFWLAMDESARNRRPEPTTERIPWTHEKPEAQSKAKTPPARRTRKPR